MKAPFFYYNFLPYIRKVRLLAAMIDFRSIDSNVTDIRPSARTMVSPSLTHFTLNHSWANDGQPDNKTYKKTTYE